MDTFIFKFSKDGETRRTAFPSQPSWAALADKIAFLFDMPSAAVAVSYVDFDEDEITLSSDAELAEYYLTNFKRGQIVKFHVQDLRARSETRSMSRTPHTTGGASRDTFGNEVDLNFDLDGDWQVPQLGGMYIPATQFEAPHGFVESVASDASSDSTEEEMHDAESVASERTMKSALSTPPVDKGKGRADDRPSRASVKTSTASILAGSVNIKPTASRTTLAGLQSELGTANSVIGDVTPKVIPSEIPESVLAANAAEAGEAAPDPPLPSMGEETHEARPLPSLSNDIAAVLTNLTTIISAHPELADGLRNIVHNASNGSYWAAHRDALHRAADEMSQQAGHAASDFRSAEEEAGRRVTEALGNIFQAFAGTGGLPPAQPAQSEADGNSVRNPAGGLQWPDISNLFGMPPPLAGHFGFWGGRGGFGPRGSFRGGSFGRHHGHHRHSHPHGGNHSPESGSPRPFGPRTPPPSHPSTAPTQGFPTSGPPPPPPPSGPPPLNPPPVGNSSAPAPPPGAPFYGMPPPPPHTAYPWAHGPAAWGWPTMPPAHTGAKHSPQELRASVEAAKMHYKKEKERYRQGREELRRERHQEKARRRAQQKYALTLSFLSHNLLRH
jgi:hypothetical protein